MRGVSRRPDETAEQWSSRATAAYEQAVEALQVESTRLVGSVALLADSATIGCPVLRGDGQTRLGRGRAYGSRDGNGSGAGLFGVRLVRPHAVDVSHRADWLAELNLHPLAGSICRRTFLPGQHGEREAALWALGLQLVLSAQLATCRLKNLT
jgi:hypothetical protein